MLLKQKMNNQSPEKLLKAYLNGSLSEAERNQLINWFMGLPQDQAESFFEEFGEAMEQLNEEEFAHLEKKLKNAADRKKQQQKLFGRIKPPAILYKIAASVLIVSSLTFLYFQRERNASERLQRKEYVAKTNDIKQKSKIVLPDGSVVWLNASSHLRFPAKFENNRRDVYLEGEAFFKVTHDKKRPFTVHAPSGLYAKVLGTSFNIKAYSFQKDIQVTVVTGKVAIGKGKKILAELVKGRQLVFNKITASVIEKPGQNTHAWIREELSFNGNTLEEIAAILEKSYDVDIEIAPGVNKSLRCKGSFNLSQNPEEIIGVLCTLHDLTFSSDNKQIIIRKE